MLFDLLNRRSRTFLLLVGLACVGVLAAAWYLQHTLKQRPCPLCILQRYAFIAIALFAFSGALFARGRGAVLAHWGGVLVASLFGGAIAIKMLFFTTAASGCGADAIAEFVNNLPTANHFPQYFFANGGCTDVYPPILGLTVPVWALVAFAISAEFAAMSLVARWRAAADSLQYWPGGHHYNK